MLLPPSSLGLALLLPSIPLLRMVSSPNPPSWGKIRFLALGKRKVRLLRHHYATFRVRALCTVEAKVLQKDSSFEAFTEQAALQGLL